MEHTPTYILNDFEPRGGVNQFTAERIANDGSRGVPDVIFHVVSFPWIPVPERERRQRSEVTISARSLSADLPPRPCANRRRGKYSRSENAASFRLIIGPSISMQIPVFLDDHTTAEEHNTKGVSMESRTGRTFENIFISRAVNSTSRASHYRRRDRLVRIRRFASGRRRSRVNYSRTRIAGGNNYRGTKVQRAVIDTRMQSRDRRNETRILAARTSFY